MQTTRCGAALTVLAGAGERRWTADASGGPTLMSQPLHLVVVLVEAVGPHRRRAGLLRREVVLHRRRGLGGLGNEQRDDGAAVHRGRGGDAGEAEDGGGDVNLGVPQLAVSNNPRYKATGQTVGRGTPTSPKGHISKHDSSPGCLESRARSRRRCPAR